MAKTWLHRCHETWRRKEWCDRNWTCHIYLPLNVGVPLKMATKESICLTLSAVQILDGRLNFNPKNAKFSSQSTIFPVRCQFFRLNKELCVWPHNDRNQTSTNMFWVLSEEVHVRSEQSEIRTGGRTSDSLMTFATRYPCAWRWQFLKCFQSSRQTPLQNETTHFYHILSQDFQKWGTERWSHRLKYWKPRLRTAASLGSEAIRIHHPADIWC